MLTTGFVDTRKDNCRSIKATEDSSKTLLETWIKTRGDEWWIKTQGGMRDGWDSDAVVAEGQCRVPGAWCHGEKSQSGRRGSRVYSTLPLTNHHQCGSNQLWCWRKMELKEKIPHAPPTQGAPMFFLLSFPPLPKSVVPIVRLERWTN